MFRYLILLFCCLLPLAAQAADTRGLRVVAKDPATNQTAEVKLYNKTYAVVIGIDQYQNLPPDRQLHNAVRDAKGVAKVLQHNFRFDKIVHLYDRQATKDRILELLTEELPRMMGPEDSLFIFWAGHGNQEETPEGDIGYLIPYDGSTDKIRTNITMTEIRDTISKKIPAKHVFYVMDACYSGLLTTRSVDTKSRRDLAYIKSITKERVRQVLTAGSKGEEVLDGGPKGHSVFTGRLIEALEAAGDFITANEIQAILKEKVYGDARGRGKAQTPGFGTLYGSGDYVFVPNMQQKVQDNKAELARIEAELKRLEAREAEAKKQHNLQQQREAEQQKKLAEARLKAEQLRQQQLAEEQQRQLALQQDRAQFEAEQQEREKQQKAVRQAEEQRLAALRLELAQRKQAVPSAITANITAAVAEVRRLDSEIARIEAAFTKEQTEARERIIGRYEKEIESVKKQSQKPLQRDEFETTAQFNARKAEHDKRFDSRISQLQAQQQQELEDLQKRIAGLQDQQTSDLRQSLKQLAERQFTVGAESLAAELGGYDADKQIFTVSINSRIPEIQVAMNGTIPLLPDEARKFRQNWQAGLVRPQAVLMVGGELKKIALVNDGDGVVRECGGGSCLSQEEKERIIYTDPKTGLQWTRDGNIAGKWMSWNAAKSWVKNLRAGGYSDWRLPTKEELETFAKQGGNRPSAWFNANGFQNVQAYYYWSSSINAGYTTLARDVNLDNDGLVYDYGLGNYFYVWPVRSGE